jgi:hypothetical protein
LELELVPAVAVQGEILPQRGLAEEQVPSKDLGLWVVMVAGAAADMWLA